MSFPTRRTFLQATLAAAASLFLPRLLLTGRNPRSFWFLNAATGDAWAVDDPVTWALDNARWPILERARERLVTLDSSDAQRVIRLVVRRCKLNLIEIQPGRVVVHFWGQQRANLLPFFKQHGLATKVVKVALIDRKRETTTVQTGDAFLYGERLAEEFPLGVYQRKWRWRAIDEQDDWTPAPCSGSNYCWEGIQQGFVPWKVLKAAWRHENAPLCRNCDKPTLLTVFGFFVAGFYKLEPRVVRICLQCTSQFKDGSAWGGPAWMVANLDERLLPCAETRFGKPVRYTLPWTPEGQVHELNLRLVRCLNEIDGRGMFFADATGHVIRMGERGSVTLPPFAGSVDGVEEWCRRAVHLLRDEEGGGQP
jgi:hypothetical protein